MQKQTKGFTLIELLVVIGIIGLLTGLATVNFQGARERARDVQRKGDLKQIQTAMELYKDDQTPVAYPLTVSWEADLSSGGYMKKVPAESLSAQASWPDYTYNRDADTLLYTLVACLENELDAAKDEVNNVVICTVGYSYTLTEP